MRPGQTRIAALDGWRGIAILLVLIDHIQFAVLGHYAYPWSQTGQHGITLFFVLSGFLITTKLTERPINLGRFYLKRFFRLMPVAWSYLAFILLLGHAIHAPLTSWDEIRACVLFYRNYVTPSGHQFAGHFWSLSIEEQFYLFWPCMLLVARRQAMWLAVSGALIVWCYRTTHWETSYRHTEVRADALFLGCLLALLLPRMRLHAAWAYPSLALLLGCMIRFKELMPLTESILFAVLLGLTTLHPAARGSRWIGFPALAWLGRVSYSVYVWQTLFMAPWLGMKVWVIGIGLPLFALGSYYMIERPSVAIGDSLLKRFPRPLIAPPRYAETFPPT